MKTKISHNELKFMLQEFLNLPTDSNENMVNQVPWLLNESAIKCFCNKDLDSPIAHLVRYQLNFLKTNGSIDLP